jgi:hypothetical protein
MSTELPKPVAHIGWVGNKVQYVHDGGTPVFTESQLREYAEARVDQMRTQVTSLQDYARSKEVGREDFELALNSCGEMADRLVSLKSKITTLRAAADGLLEAIQDGGTDKAHSAIAAYKAAREARV